MAVPQVTSITAQQTTGDLGSGGKVRLVPSYGSPLTLIVAAPPDRGGGVGGWVASERSRRRPSKWFKALPDDTMTWDLLLDLDAIGGPGLERRLRVLRDMGQPGPNHDEPPSIAIEGDIWTDDGAINWVLDDMTLGDRLWTPDGALRRQAVTLTFSRYAAVDEISAIKLTRTRNGSKPRRRVVIARGSDTLRTIALRELGDGTRWKDIRGWNKTLAKTNPDARLRTGTHITLR